LVPFVFSRQNKWFSTKEAKQGKNELTLWKTRKVGLGQAKTTPKPKTRAQNEEDKGLARLVPIYVVPHLSDMTNFK
jgi:hypothetical protein